ncbi:disk-shape morphogenesis protein volactin [Natronorubrum bangense]|uniref:Chromosome segregation ATPase-like protein n=2 Tax=Natronorubrum bangense TaxID=61858 RepID=L9WS03_9EURY|nr:hypothetical protein [Natronorubrum bangense]ELY52207.1 chromosome segregation ATPase-like protein [Natronorubrum bangense JCM 10635]QCC55314.1 chromosome segregation ATPase [Natronorubrum bangense]
MEYGLDIGPEAIRAAVEASNGVAIESVRPIVVPADEEKAESAGTETGDELFVEQDETRYAVGPTAKTLADAEGETPATLFANGVLSEAGYAGPALETLVDDVLEIDDAVDGRLCYTTPGPLVDADDPTDTHRDTVASILANRGLDVTPISSGFAVVYDQFTDDNYTGLGIRLGPQTTSVTLAYYGVPALAFSLAKGSAWVVEQAATETGHEPAQVEATLEQFALDPDAAAGEIEAALAAAFDALISDLAAALETEASENDVQQGLAVPVALAGSGVVDGLEYLLGGRFDAAPLPFSIRGVRLANDPATSAARGALAAAKDGVDAHEAVTWSPADVNDTGGDVSTAIPAPTGETTLSFDDPLDDGTDTERARADAAIDQLFARLADRDDEIQSVRADLETVFDDLESIEAETASAETVDALEDDLESVTDGLSDLEAERERYTSDLETLEGELEGVSTAYDALEDDVDSLESALTDDFDTLEATIETLETTTADERAALDDRIGDLTADLEAVAERTDTLGDQFERLQASVETLEETTASATALEAVSETVSELEAELDTVDRHGIRIDGLAGRLEEQALRIGDVSDRFTAHAERADEERAQLEGDLESIDSTLEDELEAVDSGLETIDERVTELGVDLEATTMALEDAEERLTSTAGHVTALDDELAAVHDSFRDRTADLETRLETTQETVGGLETTAADSDRVTAIEAELATLETELDDLTQTVSAVSETVAGLEERTAPAETVDALAADLDAISDDLDNRLESVDDRIEAITGKHDGLGDRAERLDDRTSDHANRLEAQRETIDDQERRLETVLTEVDDLRKLLEDGADEPVETQLSTLETRVDAIESGLETNRDDELEAIQTALETLQDRMQRREQTATDETQAVVTPLVAGGGGAGVVAGSSLVLTGAGAVGAGAVLLGLVLIGTAVALER